MESKTHWELVHGENYATDVSWYQESPAVSLRLVERAGGPEVRVLDVGCGQSGLAGPLVQRGYRHVTALDISREAIERARQRLGLDADKVEWVEADVLDLEAPEPFDLWHDRAVLHFFLGGPERRRYVESLRRNLVPGGRAIIATFAPDGPQTCSGLPVRRHGADDLSDLLGPDFDLIDAEHEVHRTPWGKPQAFQWTLFQRR